MKTISMPLCSLFFVTKRTVAIMKQIITKVQLESGRDSTWWTRKKGWNEQHWAYFIHLHFLPLWHTNPSLFYKGYHHFSDWRYWVGLLPLKSTILLILICQMGLIIATDEGHWRTKEDNVSKPLFKTIPTRQQVSTQWTAITLFIVMIAKYKKKKN